MRSLPRRTPKPKGLKGRNQNRLRLSTPLGIDISVNEKKIVIHISALGVPDKGYSRKASCVLNLISTFVVTITGSIPLLVDY
jgi:hypothetical protein